MSDCCFDPTQTTQSATREPNPKLVALDNCNNKARYDSVNGQVYAWGLPVAAVAGTPGAVTPDPTGANAIGIAVCDVTGAAGVHVDVARTGRLRWSDMAAAVGESPTDMAAWWVVHMNLAKLNIYVEFV